MQDMQQQQQQQQASMARSRQAPSQAGHLQQLRAEEARLMRELQGVRENMEVLQAQLHSAAQHTQSMSHQLDLVRRQLAQHSQPGPQV